MRILTVRQPWAWAIIHGGKDVENRTRNIAGAYRGPVAIHAGLGRSEEAFGANALMQGQRNRKFDHGVVIGVVNLWAVHESRPLCCPNRGAEPFGSPWAMADHWHLCLSNAHPLSRPIPAKGRLGLWRPDEALEAAIRKQVIA